MNQPLDDLWLGPLSNIREGRFSAADDDEVRRTLMAVPTYTDVAPVDVVRNLWFLPMFLEWQTKRVNEKSPENVRRYYELSSWVIERVGEIFGNP